MYKYKRRTNFEREREMIKVKALLEKGMNARQISKETKIPYSTCAKYIQKVTKREIEKRQEIEGDTLEDRALIIMKKYKDLADLCEIIKADPKKSVKDRLDAVKLGISAENNYYNMRKAGIATNTKTMDIDIQKEKERTPKKRRDTTKIGEGGQHYE